MKIIVTIKRTPQRDARIQVDAEGQLALQGVKYEINPFDELAVEEALRLKEKRGEVEVVVVTVGGPECQEQILAALAMGADRAVRVETTDSLDSLQVAKALAALIEKESPDLVLSGKLAVDDESGQIPLMLAGLLDWPQANQASTVEISDDGTTANVTCEVDAGLEYVELTLPAVITADLRLNEPRYASLPGIMKAKKKPQETIPFGELADGELGACRVSVSRHAGLPAKEPGVRVDSVDELVRALQERKLI